MPRFDGTGPNGQGPLTGRGMGRCRVRKVDSVPARGQRGNPLGGRLPARGLGRGLGPCGRGLRQQGRRWSL